MDRTPVPPGAIPLFIAGIWFPSISMAEELGDGISAVSIWKALKKSRGFPVMVRKALVVTERWVIARLYAVRRVYPA